LHNRYPLRFEISENDLHTFELQVCNLIWHLPITTIILYFIFLYYKISQVLTIISTDTTLVSV